MTGLYMLKNAGGLKVINSFIWFQGHEIVLHRYPEKRITSFNYEWLLVGIC